MKRQYSRRTIFAVRLFLGLFVVMNVSTSRLWAADAPKALERGVKPKEHKFWDKTNIALQLLNVGAQAADMYSTERALNRGAVEANPLFKSRPVFFGTKAGLIPISMLISYRLHQKGMHKAERLVPVIVAAPSGIGASFNLRF